MKSEEVKKIALKELKDEFFRDAVDKHKDKLRRKKPLMHILFPWKIVITKR